MPLHSKATLHLKPTYELIATKVLLSLGNAMAAIGIPLYFIHLGLTDSRIGLLTGAISFTIAILSFYLPPLLERFNQRSLLIISACVASVSLVIFGSTNSAALSALFLLFAQIALHINSSSLIVLFKDSTRDDDEFTRDTGILGSFANLGWFIGPLLGGLTISNYGFGGLFKLAGGLILLSGLYVLLFPFKTAVKKRDHLDSKARANTSFFLSSPQLRIAYLQSFGLNLWWGFVFVFIPIFMFKNGYDEATIGLFIALSQLPLFLFEYKTVGFVKRVGFRRIFTVCYLSLVVVSALGFLFFDSYLPLTLTFLLVGSLTLSFLEPISDIFFFSKVSSLDEEKTYPIYVTAVPFGNMFAKVSIGLTLLVSPERVTFLVVGCCMCFIALRALSIKERSTYF